MTFGVGAWQCTWRLGFIEDISPRVPRHLIQGRIFQVTNEEVMAEREITRH